MLERKFTKIGGQMVTGPKVEMLEEGGVPMCVVRLVRPVALRRSNSPILDT